MSSAARRRMLNRISGSPAVFLRAFILATVVIGKPPLHRTTPPSSHTADDAGFCGAARGRRSLPAHRLHLPVHCGAPQPFERAEPEPSQPDMRDRDLDGED